MHARPLEEEAGAIARQQKSETATQPRQGTMGWDELTIAVRAPDIRIPVVSYENWS